MHLRQNYPLQRSGAIVRVASTMKITALFEAWHIWDGNYPPLRRGQLVRLAFELQVTHVSELTAPTTPAMDHGEGADYRIRAQLIRVYGSGEDRFAVFVTGSSTGIPFRFYVDRRDAASFSVGTGVELEGTLALDHYLWTEFLDQYPNPPNLFYTLRVDRIHRIPIPESAIARGESGGKAMPTRVSPKEFPAVEELETMEGQTFDEEFYLIDLTTDGVPDVDLPLTFIGAELPQN